jgi:hypothetical protein
VTQPRPSLPPGKTLREMIVAGPRGVSRYTGTLLAVFIAQTLIALAAMIAVWVVLAQAFAHVPAFDEAVDGDLVALIGCIQFTHASFVAVVGIAFGAIFVWGLASWFLAAGVYGVLAHRPEGRRDTARCFGATGASLYLAYVRVALCSLPSWLIVAVVWILCSTAVAPRLAFALTTWDLVSSLAVVILPAAVLWHVASTVTDYARVELALRDETHAPRAALAYVRALGFVLRRPVTLVHGLLGWLAWLVFTVGSIWLAQGHPMYGTEGAITLFVMRQGVALARTAVRFGVLAGQVELGRTRPAPPRRVEVKLDATK